MNNSLAELYFQLIQFKKEGLSLSNRKCKKRINAIIKQAGAFESDVLGLHILGVYNKQDEEGQLLFLEGPESYFWLDSFPDFDNRGQLVEFGYKDRVTLDETYEYIVDIERHGSYQLMIEETLLLWLANPSEQIRINGEKFYYGADSLDITTTNPYGQDWMCSIHDNPKQTVDSISQYLLFWEEDRDEKGCLIEEPYKQIITTKTGIAADRNSA